MEIPDFVEKIKEEKRKKIKRFNCPTNRASSLGYAVPELQGCIRRGVYERTEWEQKALISVEKKMIFDEGNNQERIVLRDLAEAGIDVIEQQSQFLWREYEISGHIDGVIMIEETPMPIEIKSASPHMFDIIHEYNDLDKKPWLRAYKCQISLYLMHKGQEEGIFIFKNKSTGNIKQIPARLDYDLAEACLKTAETINKHVRNKTLPDRIIDRETCKNCPYSHICLPDIDFGEELKIVDDPLYGKKIDKYLELKASKAEADKLWKDITAKAKKQAKSTNSGELNILVGKYRITGKAGAGGSFRTKIEEI